MKDGTCKQGFEEYPTNKFSAAANHIIHIKTKLIRRIRNNTGEKDPYKLPMWELSDLKTIYNYHIQISDKLQSICTEQFEKDWKGPWVSGKVVQKLSKLGYNLIKIINFKDRKQIIYRWRKEPSDCSSAFIPEHNGNVWRLLRETNYGSIT